MDLRLKNVKEVSKWAVPQAAIACSWSEGPGPGGHQVQRVVMLVTAHGPVISSVAAHLAMSPEEALALGERLIATAREAIGRRPV
jgi:hypothetical protein